MIIHNQNDKISLVRATYCLVEGHIWTMEKSENGLGRIISDKAILISITFQEAGITDLSFLYNTKESWICTEKINNKVTETKMSSGR